MPKRSKDNNEGDGKTLYRAPDNEQESEPTPFAIMIDELVEFSQNDPELAQGLKWVDGEAQKRGISFYDMVYYILSGYSADAKAKDWTERLRTKSD